MSTSDLIPIFTGGLTSGLLAGAKIMAPYIIGFCVLCVVVAVIKRIFRKKK